MSLLMGKTSLELGRLAAVPNGNPSLNRALKLGIQPSSLDRVRCPIGLNIGAESPEEIAIAVIAEILSMHKDADVHASNWRDQ